VERVLKRWDQWSWVLPFAAGPDLLFMQFRPFFSVFAALYCGDCQELADSERQQSAVRYCKGCGGYGLGWGFQRGVTRFSVLQKGCSSSLTFTCDERLEAAGRLFYLLWAPAFFHCSCIFFFTSFTCARVGFCK